MIKQVVLIVCLLTLVSCIPESNEDSYEFASNFQAVCNLKNMRGSSYSAPKDLNCFLEYGGSSGDCKILKGQSKCNSKLVLPNPSSFNEEHLISDLGGFRAELVVFNGKSYDVNFDIS